MPRMTASTISLPNTDAVSSPLANVHEEMVTLWNGARGVELSCLKLGFVADLALFSLSTVRIRPSPS